MEIILELPGMEVSTGVYLIPGTIANTYLIIEPTGLTLIDTGLPSSISKIVQFLVSLGYTPDDVKHIIITHADDDHYGCLAKLKAITGATTYTSDIEAQAIQNGKSSRPLKFRGVKAWLFSTFSKFVHSKPATIDQTLSEGNIIPIMGGLQVIATPGHTPGHIALYAPTQGVLFAGDSLRSNSGKLVPSKGINTWDEQEALISVRKLAQLRARIVCVGHGPVIYEAQDKFPTV
jgi:glyoxylase-like metal-dependent hydrolase (beta-lactamase superfamily II)